MPRTPDQDTLRGVFHSPAAAGAQQTAPRGKQMGTVFDYYSISDDAKKEAKKLSEEATREFEKASARAQKATGGIQMHSGKYYAACTMGGLLACVCLTPSNVSPALDLRLVPNTNGPRASPTRP